MSNSVPQKASLETLLNVIQGWYSAGGHKKKTSNSDVSTRIGVHERSVSRQNGFLVEAGILEKEGQGKVLTQLGEQYAHALMNDLDEQKRYLAELLYSYEPTDSIVDFISIRTPDENEAIEQLEDITDQDSGGQASLETLLDLYIESGIIYSTQENQLDSVPESDYQFDTAEGSREKPAKSEPRPSKTSAETEDVSRESNQTTSFPSSDAPPSNQNHVANMFEGGVRFNVDITYDVSETENPDDVYQRVKAIKKGLDYQPHSRDPSTDSSEGSDDDPHQITEQVPKDNTSSKSEQEETDQKDGDLDSYF